MNIPYLSIVLPTYNRLYSLKSIFLPSLEKQTYKDYELIVVDDGSNDGTEDYFKSDEFRNKFPNIAERVKYIKNKNNLGAPESRNKGVKNSSGEWVWIVEDDIQIDDKDFLEKFVEISKSVGENVGIISPFLKIYNNKGYYNLPLNDICYIGKISGEIYFDPNKEVNGYVLSTHCVTFIRRNIYLNLGGHDGKIFFGNTFRDESDFYFRVINSGYRIYYAGKDLKIKHRNDLALKGGQKKINNKSLLKQELIVLKNHYLYLKKNYNFPYIRIAFFVFIRWTKHFANLTRQEWIKNLLVKFKI